MSLGLMQYSTTVLLELGCDVLVGALATKFPTRSSLPDGLLLAGWVAVKVAAGLASQTFAIAFAVLPMAWLSASCLRELQEQLAASEGLMERATDGRCTLHPQTGRILAASPRLSQVLGADASGAPLLDFVEPRDWSKVTGLYSSPAAGPPAEPCVATLLRRPSPMLPATHEFDAKLVPHVAPGPDLHVYVQVASEVRELGISFNISDDGSQYDIDDPFDADLACTLPRPSFRHRAMFQHAGGLGVARPATSDAFSQTSGGARREAAAQTEGPSGESRPPRPPEAANGVKRDEEVVAIMRHPRRPALKRRVNLCSSRRALPDFKPTPNSTFHQIVSLALPRINANGSGCCNFHIGLAKLRSVLQDLFEHKCVAEWRPFDAWQCASCLAMGSMEELEDGIDEVECFVCGGMEKVLNSLASEAEAETETDAEAGTCEGRSGSDTEPSGGAAAAAGDPV